MPNPLADEARSLSDQELAEAINEAYREMFNLQFQRGTRQLQNPMALRAARRQIARLRTILRERQQAAVAGAVPVAPLPQRPHAVLATPGQDAQEAEEQAIGADSAADAVADADEAPNDDEMALAAVGEAAGDAETSKDN